MLDSMSLTAAHQLHLLGISPPWAVFLDEWKKENIAPALADQSKVYQLPKKITMSKRVVYNE